MRKHSLAGSVAALAIVLASPTNVSAQVDAPAADVRVERDDGMDWGWLGLLGLFGLLGLRRRERSDVRVTARPVP